jgi:hypothetical protein
MVSSKAVFQDLATSIYIGFAVANPLFSVSKEGCVAMENAQHVNPHWCLVDTSGGYATRRSSPAILTLY